MHSPWIKLISPHCFSRSHTSHHFTFPSAEGNKNHHPVEGNSSTHQIPFHLPAQATAKHNLEQSHTVGKQEPLWQAQSPPITTCKQPTSSRKREGEKGAEGGKEPKEEGVCAQPQPRRRARIKPTRPEPTQVAHPFSPPLLCSIKNASF